MKYIVKGAWLNRDANVMWACVKRGHNYAFLTFQPENCVSVPLKARSSRNAVKAARALAIRLRDPSIQDEADDQAIANQLRERMADWDGTLIPLEDL